MLQVDVQRNRILLTEPLTSQTIHDGADVFEGQQRIATTSGFGNAHSPSKVIGHFCFGLLTLCILAVVVVWASQHPPVQCESNFDDKGGSVSSAVVATGILRNALPCNATNDSE